jgi:hypothetical protein
MPGRNDPSAPTFDANPAHSFIFFDEIDLLGDTFNLTSRQKIKWTTHYAPIDDIELWKMQKSLHSGNWINFKKEIYALYPGSTGDRKYRTLDLEVLTEKQVTLSIENLS